MRKSVSNHQRLKDIISSKTEDLDSLVLDLEECSTDLGRLTHEQMRIETDYQELLNHAKKVLQQIGQTLKEHEVAVQTLKDFFIK